MLNVLTALELSVITALMFPEPTTTKQGPLSSTRKISVSGRQQIKQTLQYTVSLLDGQSPETL
jgi:hypothetical protein